jgi:hypothetical protein
MPPCLDIYVVVDREREVLEHFLDGYVDRNASEDRGDEELMLLVPGAVPGASEAWEWEPAETLTRIVARGLGQPWRAFCVYLKPRQSTHDGARLACTVDGQVVLGLSLDDPFEDSARIEDARRLLEALAKEFSAKAGFIGCEEPPPLVATNPAERWLIRSKW